VRSLDPDDCYRALTARDPRFDGVFFVGVESTGIYCRPVCPARTPRRTSCRFFEHAAVAEREGFRACLRCRPERAPGHAPVDERPELVRRAVSQIAAGALDRLSVDELASKLGVTGRHLRRTLEAEVGVTPVELAQSRRLGLAKWLIQDTQLPMTDVAAAAGYESVRRFNASVAARFGCAPSALRRKNPPATSSSDVTLRLEARAPFPGGTLLAFLRGRAIPGVEDVSDTYYRRWVTRGDAAGWVHAELDGTRPGIVVNLDVSLLPHVTDIVGRLRGLFDLDARPDLIDAHLGRDAALAQHVARVPGMRVPGAFDGWELAVRAILGQQVSVRGATTVSGRLVQMFGQPVAAAPGTWTFPSPAIMASATVDQVCKIGVPGARGATIIALANVVESGAVDLSMTADVAKTVTALQEVRGIGEWTAHYVAMRALRAPDMFLSGDLAAKKALGVTRSREAELLSARWRPWRAYALMHLWHSLSPSDGQGG
jgi:AraC family transcriptional regulator of adaptative response / DNA-3-methyladenine glycosylase II